MRAPHRRFLVATFVVAFMIAESASAKDLFTGSISVGGGTPATVGTNKLTRVPDFFDAGTLAGIEPGYDLTQAVAASLDIRGLSASVSFDALGSTLRFQVPNAGIDVSFAGATRAQAQKNFESWLEGDYDSAIAPEKATTRLLQALVAHSPIDPMAGNPNSLESRMFAADWQVGTGGALAAYADGGVLPSLFKLSAGGGVYDADGYDVYSIDVPLRFGVGIGERFALRLDVPTAVTLTEGQWTTMTSAGLSLSFTPVSGWTLTPAFRIGGAGSPDVGSFGAMYSGTLTSQIRLSLGPLTLGVGNMGGIAKSVNGIKLAGYDLEYDLTNWVTRNGLYLEGSFGSETIGTGFGWRVFGNDVRFFGDELYMDNYQEIGAGLAAGLPFGGIGLSVSYLRGRNYDGVSARLSFRI